MIEALRYADEVGFDLRDPLAIQKAFDVGRAIERRERGQQADEIATRTAEAVAQRLREVPSRPEPRGTKYVSAVDVMELLHCSRSAAYRHLRRACGKTDGAKRALRVSTITWARYVARAFDR
jgi:hypothetical protein